MKEKTAKVLLKTILVAGALTLCSCGNSKNETTITENPAGSAGAEAVISGDGHVNMANIEFDTVSGVQVDTEEKTEGITATTAILHDEENTYQEVTDGYYMENFNKDDIINQINDLYHYITGSDERPATDANVNSDDMTAEAVLPVEEGGNIYICVRLCTDQFTAIRYLTNDKGTAELMVEAHESLAEEIPEQPTESQVSDNTH